MWIAILKQEFPKVIKGRFKQESGGANSVTAISKCTNKIYFVLAWSEGIPFSINTNTNSLRTADVFLVVASLFSRRVKLETRMLSQAMIQRALCGEEEGNQLRYPPDS